MKKGSMSLSINSIVIIVLAFVMLGLGLTLTNTVFNSANQAVGSAIPLTQLGAQPTASNQITVENPMVIPSAGSKQKNIGFYNKAIATWPNVKFEFGACLDSTGAAAVPAGGATGDAKPTIATIAQDVSASSAVGYQAIVTKGNLPSGTFICQLVAKDTSPTPNTVTTQIGIIIES